MGGLCSSGFASYSSVEVKADAGTMWSILSDLTATSDAVSCVQDFAFLDVDRKSDFEVGTVVRETRVYGRYKAAVRRQIVAISDDTDDPNSTLSVRFSTSFENRTSTPWDDLSNTSTLTIVPLTDTTCELVGSMAVKGNGILFACRACCWHCCNGASKEHFAKELEDIATAAEKKMKLATPAI